MIPIRDTIKSKTVPVVNNTLIGLNIFFYLVQMFQGNDLGRFIFNYGLVPARYTDFDMASYFSFGQQMFSFVSYMFLHGGFWHLLGNIWFLYIFGDNVEDHLGPFRYLAFYLLCGIGSGMFYMLFNFHSNIPIVGASGAIAGVMGAYFMLYPGSKILTLFPVLFIPFFFEIPAFFFLGFWFILQFLNAAGSSAQVSGIAWWAHIGGFIIGAALLNLSHKLPQTGVTQTARQIAEKKKTYRLQVINPSGPIDDPNLYGTIVITPFEAQRGTMKLVNIPWGFQKRLYKISVPPDTKQGNVLRLTGQGKKLRDKSRGDLLLTVEIE
ncbi:Rhomboid family intramembrane serine protease [Desulfonema limicola]|uniref:Rhomboid family intramembrane serine protease n=1 Tax=Desulfonema limicola TaxID=45656 RepID=A0A975GJD4_9BACT|nr:rhomboid family intramembrane serine protease [Desulfonema limicola]QTA83576.1 Rhomboid family intramembrane serine protease [Desulfonema limicola]